MSITYEQIFELVPNAESIAGDVIVRMDDGRRVLLGSLRNGVFGLTPEGMEVVDATKSQSSGEPAKRGRARKVDETE